MRVYNNSKDLCEDIEKKIIKKGEKVILNENLSFNDKTVTKGGK